MSFFNYLVISWALGLTGVIVYVYVRWLRRIWREYREQREQREHVQVTPQCEKCEHLSQIKRDRKGHKTYYCGRGERKKCNCGSGIQVSPPEYCSDYRPRKEQLEEEISRQANKRINEIVSELVNDEMLRAWDEDMEEEMKTFCQENSYAPVVLCEDCKWQPVCKYGQYLGDEGYCSRGERGEEVQG